MNIVLLKNYNLPRQPFMITLIKIRRFDEAGREATCYKHKVFRKRAIQCRDEMIERSNWKLQQCIIVPFEATIAPGVQKSERKVPARFGYPLFLRYQNQRFQPGQAFRSKKLFRSLYRTKPYVRAIQQGSVFPHQLFDAEQQKESGRVFSQIPTQHLLTAIQVKPEVVLFAASTSIIKLMEVDKSPPLFRCTIYAVKRSICQRENRLTKPLIDRDTSHY